MKPIFLMVGIWMLLAGAVRAAEDDASGYRTFTSKDGRSIEGRIVEYDVQKGKIQLERRGAGIVWVTPDVFSEKDKKYLKEWSAADLFRSPENLVITLGLKERKVQDDYVGVRYSLTFKNRASSNVQVQGYEYVCHVERNRQGKRDRVRMWGHWECEEKFDLQPGTHVHELRDSLLLDENIYGEEIKGVWVRIKGPSLDGRVVFRDVCLPTRLPRDFKWLEIRKYARDNLLNPALGETIFDTRRNGGKPSDKKEYREWFYEIISEIKGHIDTRNRAEGRKCFQELAELYDPEYDDDRGSMAGEVGFQARLLGDTTKALEWYEVALRVGNDENWCRLIVEILTSGDPKHVDSPKAIEYAKRLVKEDEKKPEYHTFLARAYAYGGNFARAIKAQKTAIERAEKKGWSVEAISNLGITLARYQKGEKPVNLY